MLEAFSIPTVLLNTWYVRGKLLLGLSLAVNYTLNADNTHEAANQKSYVSNLFVGKQLSLLQQILVMRSFNLEPIQKE